MPLALKLVKCSIGGHASFMADTVDVDQYLNGISGTSIANYLHELEKVLSDLQE